MNQKTDDVIIKTHLGLVSGAKKKDAKGAARQHYVTIRVEDYERLEPREWLNDSLVDFWMQWYVCN